MESDSRPFQSTSCRRALPTSLVWESANPNGIPSQSPGLAHSPYPGNAAPRKSQPQRGCGSKGLTRLATPLGLKSFLPRLPRVARSSQLWALLRNPFGIRRVRLLHSLLIGFACSVLTRAAPVGALAFSPDGDSLWFGDHKSLVVCSAKDAAIRRRVDLDFPKIGSLAFDRDRPILVVTGGTPGVSGVALLMDWKQDRILQRFTNYTDLATSAAISPDGRLLAIASADHTVDVFRLEQDGGHGESALKLEGHAGPVLAVAFSPTGRTVVTASADRSVKVWACETGKLIRSFNHHTEIVHTLAFRPVEKDSAMARPAYCATGSDDQTVRIWQPEIGRMVRIVRKHEGPIFTVVFSRDGTRLFSAGREGNVRVIDAESDEVLNLWRAHEDWIYSLALSPDGTTLASGDWAGEVKLWDITAKPARLKAQVEALRR